jgi:hypothetical protein
MAALRVPAGQSTGWWWLNAIRHLGICIMIGNPAALESPYFSFFYFSLWGQGWNAAAGQLSEGSKGLGACGRVDAL